MRVVLIILLVVALGAAVTGIASNAYQAGLMRGQTQSQAAPPQTGPPPYPSPYYYGPYWHPPFGFGFFGFLLPLLFIFFIFALLKGAFWGGRGHWHSGPWKTGVPPALEEWHRRAHESGPQGQKM